MSFSPISVAALTLASVFMLSACGEKAQDAAKPAAAVSAVAQKYEGKIVRQAPANRGKDDGWYLVKNGQRKWISDGAWLAKNGFDASAVIEISGAEFAAMPEDPAPVN